MKQLYFHDYDFYLDNCGHILPAIETIGLFDFFTYCKKYRKAGDEILRLPIRIKQAINGKHIKEFNRLITKIAGKQYFHIKKVAKGEANFFNIFETNLGLYMLFLTFGGLDWDDDIVTDALDKILGASHIKLIPKNKTGEKLLSILAFDKSNRRYEDCKCTYGTDLYGHVILYKELKKSGKTSINISKNLPIELSGETALAEEKEYTYKMHEDFTDMVREMAEIRIHNNIGDNFDVVYDDDSLLVLGYMVFNEFVLGNKTIFAQGDFVIPADESLGFEYPLYCDHILTDEKYIARAIMNSSNSFSFTLTNIYYEDVYAKSISDLKIVKTLRDNLKPSTSDEVEDTSREELLTELKLIAKTVDSANVIIDLGNKGVKSSKAEFHVNDTSRIEEMKQFTSDTGGASIQNYKGRKNHIEGKRYKFYGDKKHKNGWNTDT